jgi:hypothetical protein
MRKRACLSSYVCRLDLSQDAPEYPKQIPEGGCSWRLFVCREARVLTERYFCAASFIVVFAGIKGAMAHWRQK